MAGPRSTVSAAMDRRWLEEAAQHAPVLHAYALWDLDFAPDRVEFRVLHVAGVPTSYLLIWRGSSAPMVHWVGPDGDPALLEALPPRPLVAIVPEDLRDAVVALRGPAVAYGVRIMSRRPGTSPLAPVAARVRRLGPPDRGRLLAFADRAPADLAASYRATPLPGDPGPPSAVWGAFEGEEIVGVARTTVHLPSVWIVSGVFVDPEHRGQGLGRALAAAAAVDAESAGAVLGLYVRDDNLAAVRAYERAGFRTLGRREWIDAGGNRAP